MSGESILRRLAGRGIPTPRLRIGASGDDGSRPETPGPDRYAIGEELGHGGSGVVLRAHDADLGRDVALKRLHRGHVDVAGIVERFVEEAQIGAQLQHPGIVPVYDLGLDEDGRPFFAMKLVRGETLAALLARREEPSEDRRELLRILEAVGRAVSYAHARGVVHRDLMPDNVLVGAFGEVVVVDWGLAAVRTNGEGQASSRTVRAEAEGEDPSDRAVLGTLPYLSPEQVRGDPEAQDPRADVFSLGAILLEILTGGPAWVADRPEAIARQAADGDLAEAFGRLDGCGSDDEMVALCRHCIAPDPGDRPPDATVLADAVAAYLAEAEERTHRSRLDAVEERGPAARSRREADEARSEAEEQRRRRRTTIVLAAAGVLILLGAAGAWLGIERARQDRIAARVAAVEDALEDAHRRRGEEGAEAALVDVDRAFELAAAEDVPTDLRDQAAELRDELEAEAERDRRTRARRAFEDALLAELRDVDLTRDDAGRRLRAAFERRSIEMTPMDRPDRSAELATILAEAAVAGEEPDLLATARALDPDPLREEVRTAWLKGEADQLGPLAGRALDGEELDLPTLDLLGRALLDLRGAEETIAFLRRAYLRHPGDLGVCRGLRRALTRMGPEHAEETAGFATAVVALEPEDPSGWHTLARQLLASGKTGLAVTAMQNAARLFAVALEAAPDEVACASLRARALGWLREDLLLEDDPGRVRPYLETWRASEGWAGVRAVSSLPTEERDAWTDLWDQLGEVLR